MFKVIIRNVIATSVVLLAVAMCTSCSDELQKEEEALVMASHPRHARQLHRMLDPFGLLGKAGEAVNGAVAGMHSAVEGIGKTLDEGAQHVGKMLEEGATSFDSAFKGHIDQMSEGMEEAGKVARIVSEDLVESVSSLVSNHLKAIPKGDGSSSSLASSSSTEEEVRMREGIVDGVLRMVGIDPSGLGLMALNVLIFLAEMITSSLIGDNLNEIPETRGGGGSSMFSWLLNKDPLKVDSMLKEAQDPALPRHIIEKLVSTTGDSTACVQLLVCKMSPIIWGIQGSVKEYGQARGMDDPDAPDRGVFQSLYDSLPKLDDFVRFSESCETQFPSCPLLSLSDLGL